MSKDLFPSEIATKFLSNIEKTEEIKDPKIWSFNEFTGYKKGSEKYSLNAAEIINSTPMPISSNSIINLKRKEKDQIKNKLLEIQIPKNEKSIINSLIEINEKAPNLSKSDQQTLDGQMIINENHQLGLSHQIHPNNNNQKNQYFTVSSYPGIKSQININTNKKVINKEPQKRLSLIIADLFNRILSDSPSNDVGTDNMTCILIQLKNPELDI